VGMFCSVMWSNIFSLAIEGLGSLKSQGSSLLVMGILGAAVLSPSKARSRISTAFNTHSSCRWWRSRSSPSMASMATAPAGRSLSPRDGSKRPMDPTSFSATRRFWSTNRKRRVEWTHSEVNPVPALELPSASCRRAKGEYEIRWPVQDRMSASACARVSAGIAARAMPSMRRCSPVPSAIAKPTYARSVAAGI